jgi:hypothetical protein
MRRDHAGPFRISNAFASLACASAYSPVRAPKRRLDIADAFGEDCKNVDAAVRGQLMPANLLAQPDLPRAR